MQPKIAPSRPVMSSSWTLPRWASLRILHLGLLSTSMYLLITAAACPNSKLAVTVITTKDVGNQPPGMPSSDSFSVTPLQPATLYEPYKIRVGLFDACVWDPAPIPGIAAICSGRYYEGFSRPEPQNETMAFFMQHRLLQATTKGLEGLGRSAPLVPTAAGTTSLVILYFMLSFLSYARPAAWRPYAVRDALLTSRGVVVALSLLTMMITCTSWTMLGIVQMAARDALSDIVSYEATRVRPGGVMLLVTLATLLQIAALCMATSFFAPDKEDSKTADVAAEADATKLSTKDIEANMATPIEPVNADSKVDEFKRNSRPPSYTGSAGLPDYKRGSFLAPVDKKETIAEE